MTAACRAWQSTVDLVESSRGVSVGSMSTRVAAGRSYGRLKVGLVVMEEDATSGTYLPVSIVDLDGLSAEELDERGQDTCTSAAARQVLSDYCRRRDGSYSRKDLALRCDDENDDKENRSPSTNQRIPDGGR